MLLKVRFSELQRDALVIAAAVCIIALIHMAMQALQVEFWRHDAARYLSDNDFLIRARNDGRWINYMLRAPTAAVDPRLAWVLNYLAIGAGLFLIFLKITQDKLTAVLLALTGILFPGLAAQATWPDATLPGAITFLISVVLVQRFGWSCLPVVAILQFATMQYFYYLLPLALLPPLAHMRINAFNKSVRIGVLWASGVLLGYFTASFANLLLVGEFGIQVSSWRNPNIATDFTSLIANAQRYAGDFIEKNVGWLPRLSLAAFPAMLAAAIYSSARSGQSNMALFTRGAYALVVLFGAYIFVLPLGINVPYRSLFPMAVGLIAMPIVLADRRLVAPLTIALFVFIGLPSIYHSVNGMAWYSNHTRTFATVFYRDLPPNGGGKTSIVVDGRGIDSFYRSVETNRILENYTPIQFAMESRHRHLGAMFKELGYRDIRWCLDKGDESLRRNDDCSVVFKGCDGDRGRICVLDEGHDMLAVRLVP